jgi:hypothetical protein
MLYKSNELRVKTAKHCENDTLESASALRMTLTCQPYSPLVGNWPA